MNSRRRWIVLVGVLVVIVTMMIASWNERDERRARVIAGDLNFVTATAHGGTEELQSSGSPIPMRYFEGEAAISVSGDIRPGKPAFGEEAVYQYFENNPPNYWDPSTQRPQIVEIQFLVAAEAEKDLNTSIPRPPDDLLCVVKLRGVFIPRMPPGVTPIATPEGEVLVAVVFDAVTGNFLGQGSLPE